MCVRGHVVKPASDPVETAWTSDDIIFLLCLSLLALSFPPCVPVCAAGSWVLFPSVIDAFCVPGQLEY